MPHWLESSKIEHNFIFVEIIIGKENRNYSSCHASRANWGIWNVKILRMQFVVRPEWNLAPFSLFSFTRIFFPVAVKLLECIWLNSLGHHFEVKHVLSTFLRITWMLIAI